jgi:hypothetical protein
MQTTTSRACALLFAAVLSLSACGKPPGADTIDTVFDACEPLVVQLEDDVLAVRRDSVVEAIGMWNSKAGTQLTLDAVEGAPVLPLRFEEAAAAFHGFYDDEKAEIWINTRLTDDAERRVTIAHELGHAFGLYHVPPNERKSIMNNGNLQTGIVPADVEALQAEWGACP